MTDQKDQANGSRTHWTEAEEILLMEEINKRKDIIEGKFTNGITSKAKADAWNEVHAVFQR